MGPRIGIVRMWETCVEETYHVPYFSSPRDSLDTTIVGEAQKRLLFPDWRHRAQADLIPIGVPMDHVEFRFKTLNVGVDV